MAVSERPGRSVAAGIMSWWPVNRPDADRGLGRSAALSRNYPDSERISGKRTDQFYPNGHPAGPDIAGPASGRSVWHELGTSGGKPSASSGTDPPVPSTQ